MTFSFCIMYPFISKSIYGESLSECYLCFLYLRIEASSIMLYYKSLAWQKCTSSMFASFYRIRGMSLVLSGVTLGSYFCSKVNLRRKSFLFSHGYQLNIAPSPLYTVRHLLLVWRWSARDTTVQRRAAFRRATCTFHTAAVNPSSASDQLLRHFHTPDNSLIL